MTKEYKSFGALLGSREVIYPAVGTVAFVLLLTIGFCFMLRGAMEADVPATKVGAPIHFQCEAEALAWAMFRSECLNCFPSSGADEAILDWRSRGGCAVTGK